MNFKKYIDESWAQHDKQPDELLKNYHLGLNLIETEIDVLGLARLVHHVATDHNFKFDEGRAFLEKLKALPLSQSAAVLSTLNRNIITMRFLNDPNVNLEDLSDSDCTIIYVIAAASYLFQKKFEKVEGFLNRAIILAEKLKPEDPASRILAMSSNNMAVELSEKENLTEEQKTLMIRTAQYSRKFWEMAGTWLQVERSEYDLSKYYLKLSEIEKSKQHANLCLQICEREKAEPLEFYFVNERFALICKTLKDQMGFSHHLQQMKTLFTQCSEKDQTWMKESLVAVES